MPRDRLSDYVFEIVRQCAPEGGYALGSGNSITNYMKIENYQAMLHIGARYGKYPQITRRTLD